MQDQTIKMPGIKTQIQQIFLANCVGLYYTETNRLFYKGAMHHAQTQRQQE